jgi:hypothetical protein
MYTYKATNTSNGKFYIGSALDFEKRKKQHLKGKENYPFQRELRKNPEMFEWEVWSDDTSERILEQALLDMWFDTEQCYNLSSCTNRPNSSPESLSKGGLISKELKLGIHSATSEELSEWGTKGGSNPMSGILSYKNKTGIFGITPEEKTKAIKKGGKTTFESGVGCFAPENIGKGARTTNSTLWEDPEHPELGFLQAGPLARRQKKLGLPHGPENRVRVKTV